MLVGSGTVVELTNPWIEVSPRGGAEPELGATIGVGEKAEKVVVPKVPLSTISDPQETTSEVLSVNALPPFNVPMKCPVPPSVISWTVKVKVWEA